MNHERKTDRRTTHGQALAEMGIVILLLLVMVFGIIEFGRMLMLTNMVVHAARDGARIAAVLPQADFPQAEQHVRDLLGTSMNIASVTVVPDTDPVTNIGTVTVTVTGDIPYIFDFSALGLWSAQLDIARSVTFRRETNA